MKKLFFNIFSSTIFVSILILFQFDAKAFVFNNSSLICLSDSNFVDSDTIQLLYPFKDETNHQYFPTRKQSGLYLNSPTNIKTEIKYNPETNLYEFTKKIGNFNYRLPISMSQKDYLKYDFNNSTKNYWKEKVKSESFEHQTSLIPKLHVGGEVFQTIFGSNTIDIKPRGTAELSFGLNMTKTDNPLLAEELRKNITFDFKEKIQMNVKGKIGDNLELGVTYNTESSFEFDNKMKLKYTGKEDDIIQKIEAGNVALPLSGSLITGSQSLFGILTELKFGKLSVTSVFSKQNGETSVIEVQGGAQKNTFEISASDYDANRHFFLAQYFKEHYNDALKNLPVISSSVNITKIEVWITNKSSNFQNSRNILAFMDLGEDQDNIFASPFISQSGTGYFPDNDLNSLYDMMVNSYSGIRDINDVTQILTQPNFTEANFVGGQDYEKIENARPLSSSEYKINKKLGYISLNAALNGDEVLAVAFEYTANGKTYKVGEFSNEGVDAPKTLVLKLLKGTSFSPQFPTWELMMKNIYSIGAYQVNSKEFRFDIMYRDDETGALVYSIPAGDINGKKLLRALNLDNLNSQLEFTKDGDGVFDFIDGYTINASNGRIIFPVLQPFGKYLEEKINKPEDAAKYIFNELYDSTQNMAQQLAEKNKFFLSGEYQSSSSSEISLNAISVPEGSVVVTAGGMQLVENQDYTVDYAMGRVKIINQGLLESGTPIKISLESNSMFSIQTKRLMGSHLDYRFSDNFNVGATILNLNEHALTQKVNIGDEPISNTIWGFNGSFRTDAPILTRLIDKLPLIETKEKSSISINGEFAHLIPGHSKSIKGNGESYIDDFEGSKSTIDIKSIGGWVLSSTPQGQPSLFPEASLNNDIAYGFNRAKFSWYYIDPLFSKGGTPVSSNQQSSLYVRPIFEKEIFPNKQSQNNIITEMQILNLAFYPREKGPYNFDVDTTSYSKGINEDGLLNDPELRWGGIMRKITTNDFESANIEYVEFWVMDPFAEDSINNVKRENTDAAFYINLGNISEDVLKDSRKSFENGLPTSDNITMVDTTVWGRIPLQQSMVNAFDNQSNSRQYQDVGIDGLNSDDEKTFYNGNVVDYLNIIETKYGKSSPAYINAYEDPSSDDYHYFRGKYYDDKNANILERYKNYNNLEGNSPSSEQSTESFPTSATTLPDVEDINHDNTLSESESYFQYKVKLSPEDLKVGYNFVTDVQKANVTLKNGQKRTVNWYQFKVPIHSPDKIVGSIKDFKSIRFMRMFLKGVDNPIVLRFAKLELVRGEWRKYNYVIKEADEALVEDNDLSSAAFNVATVSIEENGNRQPIPYVLPPDIERERDVSNVQLREMNEQSIVLEVDSLSDGYSKAAYKNINMDVREYKRIQMEVHAEAFSENQVLNDGDLSVFVRLGSDFQENYYEYEIPLDVTPPGTTDREVIWPEENRLDVEFELFLKVKQLRNNEIRNSGTTVSLSTAYEITDGKNTIRIKGNPNLSNVRTIMLGVRNPKQKFNSLADDGNAKSGEIWLDELRLTDFKEQGGWAANARVTAKLADFATISLAGSTQKPGFGSIEKKVSERSKEDAYQYDLSSNFELGKFFPKKSQVRIPMYVGYSESFINPQYNPLDADIPLEVTLDDPALSTQEKDSIKKISQTYTKRKSLNFTNVGINKSKGKPKFYSVSNIGVSYSYSEMLSRNINTKRNLLKNHSGSINYIFNNSPKNIIPFKQSKLLRAPAFKLIKDFNFYLAPTQISFRTNMNRKYNEVLLRNINNLGQKFDPTFDKQFIWNRIYNFKYNLTKSLKFDFSANNVARIDEPEGLIDKDEDDYEAKRDTILNEIKNGGTTTNYNHRFNISYTVPINKIPMFNWVSLTTRYSATYDWRLGPKTIADHDLGNIIKNSNREQATAQLNLLNLYNKVGFLNKINKKYRNTKQKKEPKVKYKDVKFERDNVKLKADVPKSILHKLKTEQVKVKAFDENNKAIKIESQVINEDRVAITATKDYKNIKIIVTGKKEVKENLIVIALEHIARTLMAVKNVSLSYSEQNGTVLPGYNQSTKILGQNKVGTEFAPGIPFILGIQDKDFARKAIDEGWLTKDSILNSPYLMTFSNTFTVRSSIEPINGLRIDISGNRNFSRRLSEYYYPGESGTFEDGNGDIVAYNPMTSGNFSMTFIALGTAFEKAGNASNNYYSAAFEKFKNIRYTIANRLAVEREKNGSDDYQNLPNSETGFPDGYGPTSQEVIIPAFLAAYGNIGENNVTLKTFPSLLSIKPNWRVNYDGLTKIEFVKKYFKTLTLSHSYSSTFNIGSYTANTNFDDTDGDGFSKMRDQLQNFVPQNDIYSFTLSEQFSPLISMDMTWKNNILTKLEYKKNRNLTMSLQNKQLTELIGKEIVIGTGYRFNKVKIIVKTGGRQKVYDSDLNIRLDFSLRDNITITRKLVEDQNTPTAGQKTISLKFTADYVLSKNLSVRAFFDTITNDPKISQSYKNTNSNVGFSLRYTLTD
ncbi:MAG: cell surface protein SprA [Bacteroidales bacterium]|nr:cell surface protein SprA [Bacteroidales bacterium]